MAIEVPSVAALLPNQKYQIGDDLRSLADGVAIGEVTAVEPGAAFMFDDAKDDDIQLKVFDDPRAEWRIATVTVAIDYGLGTVDEDQETARFALRLFAEQPIEEVRGDLLNTTVFVPIVDAYVYAFDPELPQMSGNGQFLGVFSDEGLVFPAKGKDSAEFVDGLNTIEAVLEESKKEKDPVIALF